ncbi:uncharacterized protein LOC109834387 [Asparagus officinalis]|uniref:uncharacterized protein LOC109834387 n=1 Tax=Asparagus officinalis TaxID=4686 RepID=UPI00098DE8AE|nr:uncharacterized protein LOC109834387 [Asparagus officinalis]
MCSKSTPKNLREFQRTLDQSEARLRVSKPKMPVLPTSSTASTTDIGTSASLSIGVGESKRRGSNTVKQTFNMGAREELDALIGKMFYTGRLFFNLTRNPYYAKAFAYAANNPISGYKPPGYNFMRTTILQHEKTHVERLMESIRGTWQQKGVSICSDGWADAQRRPIINFMVVCEGKPMFLNAVNAEGEVKNKYFIQAQLKKCITEVRPKNIIQIITDNVSACKAAGGLVEGTRPHIFWTPYVVHTLNLAIKNICAAKNMEANAMTYAQLHWITEISDDALFIKNFIMNHYMRLSMFNDYSKMKLLSIADTRFASWIIMLKMFKVIKRGLQDMVLSDR